jgi:hypothetical protein
VQWIVVDQTVLGPPDRVLLHRVLTQGPYRVVLRRDGMLVARRVRR